MTGRACGVGIVLCALLAGADAGPRIFYSKSFPGSKPAYMEIFLDTAGKAEYREGPEEDNPIVFQLSREETKTIFELADKLERFKKPLESGLKVANMGMKTYRYLDGATKTEVKFNYSLEEDAKTIQDWFEKMCESAYHRIDLERAARFDKLGVNQSILQLQAAWERKRLVGVAQYLPMLDRVAKNESYLHMARQRAAALADTFRAAEKAKAE